MKLLFAVFSVIFITACSSAPPKPPEPKGNFIAINPPFVLINNLYTK